MSGRWMVTDGCGDYETFPTANEAVAKARHWMEVFNDGETWDESVTGIVVAYVTHEVAHYILGVKSELTDEEWHDVGGRDDIDEVWDFQLERIDPPVSYPKVSPASGVTP